MTRLLMVLQDLPFFTTHRLSIARAARARGWEVHVTAPADPRHEPTLAAAGLVFHPLPLRRGGTNPLEEARAVAFLWRLMGDVRPDVVHLVSAKPMLYGGLAARLRRVPAVVHAVTGLGHLFSGQGLGARAARALALVLYRIALGHPNTRTIFQNPDDLAAFRERGLVRPGDVVVIRGCGVDPEMFRPPAEPRPPGPVEVLFTARLLADKGIHEFVAAARRLRAEGLDARFTIVGRHDPENPTDVGPEIVADWVAEGVVAYRGFSTDMPGVLRATDIVCLPSYYGEGLPRGLIEAAATGLPIVTADTVGCREAVIDGQTGLLVPARDADALADALRRLIVDPAMRARMGAAGRDYAVAEFTEARFLAQSLAVYDALLTPAAG